ncbi:unnamed protein product, partial [Prorocentrum cordatum]
VSDCRILKPRFEHGVRNRSINDGALEMFEEPGLDGFPKGPRVTLGTAATLRSQGLAWQTQCNLPNLVGAELLVRRKSVLEEARSSSPSDPDYSALDIMMGWAETQGMGSMPDALMSCTANRLKDKAAISKEKRKAIYELRLGGKYGPGKDQKDPDTRLQRGFDRKRAVLSRASDCVEALNCCMADASRLALSRDNSRRLDKFGEFGQIQGLSLANLKLCDDALCDFADLPFPGGEQAGAGAKEVLALALALSCYLGLSERITIVENDFFEPAANVGGPTKVGQFDDALPLDSCDFLDLGALLARRGSGGLASQFQPDAAASPLSAVGLGSLNLEMHQPFGFPESAVASPQTRGPAVLLYPEDLGGIDPDTIYQGLPSGRPLTLLAAGYSSTVKARAGEYWGDAVVDGAVDTGNNAWAALAFAHYAAAAGARSRPEAGCYAAVGRDILEALARAAMCSDALGGYLGRLPPYEDNYRSTEHNIDMAALAQALGDTAVAAHAERFVQQMHARNPGYPQAYSMGTGKELRCDSSQPMSAPVATDVQFWSLLAGADPEGVHAAGAVEFALRRPGPQLPPLPEGARDAPGSPEEAARIAATQGLWESDEDSIWAGDVAPPRLNGTRFTTWGHGIEWEETASACMAMVKHRQQLGGEADPRLALRIDEARNSLCYLLAMYKGIPATVLGGNMEAWKRNDHRSVYPGGSDTGIKWTYLRYLHVAATAWTGLLLLYQADGSSPVLEDANPLGVPADGVPRGQADLSCLPPRPRPRRDAPSPSSSRRRGEPGRRVD